MAQALALWAVAPTQIESDLQIYCHGRSIGEWHRGEMSSRKLLVLLEGLPDKSEFKKAYERRYRVIERIGADGKPELFLRRAVGRPEPGTKVIAEYTDWTQEQCIAARQAAEIACLRAEMRRDGGYEPDLTGLQEPLHRLLLNYQRNLEAENRKGANNAYKSALYASERS